MESAPNELSDFNRTELVRCGEILVSSKQKEFWFGCVQCNGVFSQMPTFARHLQWAHQSDELLGDEIKLKDMSVYTVEELLSYNDATTNVNGDVSIDAGIRKSNADDNDTGIDSDVELEKEIEELLTSMAETDTSSGHDTECSQSDSGVESRNNTDQYYNVSNQLNDMHYKKGQKTEVDILVEDIWKTPFDDETNNLQTTVELLESEDFDSMENDSSLCPEETISTTESLSNVGESTDDGIHMNYAESSIEKSSKVEENYQACEEELYYRIGDEKRSTAQDEKTTCKGSIFKILNSNEEGVFITENVNINKKDQGNTVIKEHASTVKHEENLLGLDNERYEELDMLSNGEIECGRDIFEDSPFINVVLLGVDEHVPDEDPKNDDLSYVPKSDELSHQDEQSTTKRGQCEEPYVIAEIDDELAEIQFSKEEIDQMKSCMPDVPLFNVKETELDFKIRTTNLSGFQMEYLGFNESAASNECALSNVVEAEVAEEPLDLSFDKNALVIDVQLQDNSELLGCDNNAETSLDLITTQEDMLMANKSISTDNTNLSIEYNKMHCCQSIEGHRLPPFSKIFRNTANTLRANNGFLAQSTPKQKQANSFNNKTVHLLKHSAQTVLDEKNPQGANELAQNPEDVENVTPSPKSSDIRNCPQRKCKILKRFGKSYEKENKPKKKKTDILITKEDVEATVSGEKPEIQILSVDIIVPGEITFTNNPSPIKPKTEEYRAVEKLVTRTEKCETIACSDKSQYAADSTSEYPATSFSEINYTPEDTLNQLKLEAATDKHLFDSIMQNSLNDTAQLNCNINQSSLIDGNSSLDESIPSTATEEERENFVLLRSIGLKIIADANAEDGLKLEHLETMRSKASDFAKIYIDFKYLWKVGSGIKSYEELELDFNKLMHRINEKFELELTIAHTKRIINLISLWYMQTYHKWLIDKKPAVDPICHYLHLFMYLPKTARRIFYCEECPRYFLAQQKYLSHREKHMAITPSCPYCQTTFDSRGTQLLHTTICSTFKCIECANTFENAASLEYHVRSKHLLQCEKCGKLCSNAADLDWHEHQYPIVCGLCNRLFDTPTDLQKHRQDSFHWDYTCRTCEVFLPTATQMKQHLSVCSGN
ncbi:PREDICTED: uncharacterized protein LOC108366739 [Rhagoletis zephyria]|uniref:uncharacterized protein LOC108366739 n=1 Tax=Rhagoletis zephyria TaxID=28612 RepID=UPI0008112A64|nr:PREDICTED: uncharacterized protein LOC108366739 [Rhagoletis zephyria]